MIFDSRILIAAALCLIGASQAFYNDVKDPGLIDDGFMREILADILSGGEKDPLMQDESPKDYVDDETPYGMSDVGMAMMERVAKNKNELFASDYFGDPYMSGPVPSLRDVEHIEKSVPWWKHQIAGGAGEGPYVKHPQVKTDAKLPAYCNPPNPCPVGFSEDQGCINEFENSASFSREYQSAQECMCDTEHMFECPANIQLKRQQNFQYWQLPQEHKNLVAKKFWVKKVSWIDCWIWNFAWRIYKSRKKKKSR